MNASNLRPLSTAIPITIFSVDDVFVTGFGKSGNTWLQNLVAGIFHNLDLANVPDSIIQELVPDVGYKSIYQRFSERMVFKTHETAKPDYRHVVLLIRDARDVMISYLHFDAALSGVPPEAIDFVDHVQRYAPGWRNHVEGWLNNPYNAHLITLRYEDLANDCVGQLLRLCSFMGIQRDRQLLESVAQNASFAEMQRREVRFGWDNPRWPRDRRFCRRGIVGSYRDEMPDEALRACLDITSATLLRCGYEIDTRYELGTIINFGKGGDSERFRAGGWSRTEEQQTWSEGNSATLAFTGLPGNANLHLRTRIGALIQPPQLPSQPVAVYANGKRIADWSVSDTNDYSATIPIGSVTDGSLKLEFKTPKATSPKALRQNQDTRLLGIRFHTLTIDSYRRIAMSSIRYGAVNAQNLRALSRAIPSTIFSVDDIFIAGFPKSGNTWCQTLAAGILHNFDLENVPHSVIQKLAPDLGEKSTYQRFSERMVFKTHETARPDYRHVVLLIRDVRDVMVSYLHFDAALLGVPLEAIDFVEHVQRYAPAWRYHVEGWLDNLYNAHLITVRYEDLAKDCVGQLSRLCAFMGIKRDRELLESVAQKASFAEMRRRELRFGWDDPRWPRDRRFCRRGIVGSYRDEMPDEVLRACLEITAPTLLRCGYDVCGYSIDTRYETGTVISFGKGGHSERFRTIGWSYTEEQHTWSEGSSATLFFTGLPENVNLNLRTRIDAIIQPPQLASQPVAVYANGKRIADWSVSDTKDYSAIIPAGSVRDGSLKLEFKTPKATSPKPRGQNQDIRRLGIRVHTLTIG
jgi:Sulfotransferase domain